jgi:excisionase family DNA binding protein
MPPHHSSKRLVSIPELAQYTGLSLSFWRKYWLSHSDLRQYRIGRRVLVDLNDVDVWLQKRARLSTSQTVGE